MAIDEDDDKIRGFAEGITFPVLMDPDHALTELYAISNVPTVVLIDEDDRISMPNWNAYGCDMFREFTGIESDRQHDRIRHWVRDGDAGMDRGEAVAAVEDLSAEEEAARLHFRLATTLRSRGDQTGADRNFDQAAALAPGDWTIRRAMIPLRGGDPFGSEFFELYEEWQALGMPYHGVRGY